jgi:hypothetical protein
MVQRVTLRGEYSLDKWKGDTVGECGVFRIRKGPCWCASQPSHWTHKGAAYLEHHVRSESQDLSQEPCGVNNHLRCPPHLAGPCLAQYLMGDVEPPQKIERNIFVTSHGLYDMAVFLPYGHSVSKKVDVSRMGNIDEYSHCLSEVLVVIHVKPHAEEQGLKAAD